MDTSPARHAPFPHSAGIARGVAALLCGLLLGGCASGGGLGKVVDRTLQTVGLREAETGPRTIPIELMAGDNLNAGTGPRGLALVVKVYQLRSAQRFEQAPFEAFLDEAGERAALGEDLVSVNEIVLTPGARRPLSERVGEETAVLGLVALFQAPASNRWRLAFDAGHDGLPEEGLTVGLHACAMTASSPALVTRLAADASSLASVRCLSARR